MDIPKINPFFATPCYKGLVTFQFFISFLKLSAVLNQHGISHNNMGFVTSDSLVTRARNSLVAMFLENKSATHLMFIDADIGFDPRDIVKMLKHDQDVVAGVYPKKQLNWEKIIKASQEAKGDLEQAGAEFVMNLKSYSNNPKKPKYNQHGNLIEALDAGAGFILIKREVIEKIIKAFPQLRYNDNSRNDPKYKPYYFSIFDTMIDPEDKKYLSEDFTFCRRWQSLGGKIWIDPTVKLTHTGDYTYTGEFLRYFKPRTKDN